jgi:TetR/AcrR family transcriptional repressor of bet genes
VVAERGYVAATMQAVAEQAGLSPGLLHYHFKTRGEILRVAMGRLVEALGHRAAKRLEQAGESPRKRLLAMLDAYVALDGDAAPVAVRAWGELGSQAHHDDDVRALYTVAVAGAVSTLTELVRAALVERGGTRAGAADGARALLCLVEGCFRLAGTDAVPQGHARALVHASVDAWLDAAAAKKRG